MRRGLSGEIFGMKDAVTIDRETFNPAYEIPKDDSVIWRFLALAKFISPQKERALYLPRANKFEDQFEGEVCLLKDADLKTS